MITVGQLIDFILENRTDKVFKGYTKEEVAGAVEKGLQDGTLFYDTDGHKVTGMVLAEKIPNKKVMFVIENLAMSIDRLRKFAQKSQQMYPGWKLEAMRHNKHRIFNTEKLYKKLVAL